MTPDKQPFRLQFDGSAKLATLTVAASRLCPLLAPQLADTIDEALAHPQLRGVIVCSAQDDFCAGTDIEWLTQQDDPALLLDAALSWHRAVRRLETAGKPVVALLGGSARGAGFELALSAHHRIALEHDGLRVGLSDLTFGLIPCAGAGQRLSRMRGCAAALDLLMRGRLLGAKEAQNAGLVDQLCAEAGALRPAAEQWIAQHPESRQPWDLPGYLFPAPEPGSRAASDLFIGAAAALYNKTAGALEAPKLLLSALQEGAALDFDRALEVEARLSVRSALSGQAADMTRTLWSHKRAAKASAAQGFGLAVGEAAATSPKVAIVGAGMMGADLAFVAARAGCEVVIKDVAQSALDRARARIQALGERGRQAGSHADAVLARIHPTLELSQLKGADLLIEAVFESLSLKQKLLAETEPLLAEGGIWASNTSALPIGAIAKDAARPGHVLGLHFFSPANRMELVEVVKSPSTEQGVVSAALGFCRQLGKVPILVNDGYGFYTTRVFAAYVLEGMSLLAEGVAPAQIEWEARSAGMVVGPLQVADEVSLELVQHIVEQRRQFGQRLTAPRAERLLAQMLECGRPGRAGSAGFYRYRDGRRDGLWRGLSDLVDEQPAADATAIVGVGHRLLLAQAVEAGRTLDEGVVERHRDADLGAVLGVGFAPTWGGPLSYLDRVGIRWAVDRLEQLAATEERFEPPALLQRMAAAGERFFSAR